MQAGDGDAHPRAARKMGPARQREPVAGNDLLRGRPGLLRVVAQTFADGVVGARERGHAVRPVRGGAEDFGAERCEELRAERGAEQVEEYIRRGEGGGVDCRDHPGIRGQWMEQRVVRSRRGKYFCFLGVWD